MYSRMRAFPLALVSAGLFTACSGDLATDPPTSTPVTQSGVAAARQFAIFEHSTNSYLFVSDGVDGIGANDVMFQLSGVTGLGDSTLTAGNLTIQ